MNSAQQPKLVLLLTHGIGEPQPGGKDAYAADQQWFVKRVTEKVEAQVGPGLLSVRWADWSDLYVDDCERWLELMFPYSLSTAQQRRRAWRMLGWALLMGLIVSLGPMIGTLLIPERCKLAVWMADRLPWLGLGEVNVLLGWLLGTVLLLILAILAARLIFKRLPWGQVWYFARRFEAGGLSDIVMYLSPIPKQAMLRRLLDALEPELERIEEQGENRLPVVLSGHSLGSVLVYDLLCASTASGWRPSLREHSGTILAQLEGELQEVELQTRSLYKYQAAGRLPNRLERELRELEERKLEISRLVQMISTLQPMGLCTFGSPISFFTFRDPPGIDPLRAFEKACPAMFKQQGQWGKVRWRWLNFWHSSDPVAHRLAPMLRAMGWPNGRAFVEDVRLEYPAPQPVAAHLFYWRQEQLADQLARQLVDWINQLP